MKFKFDITASKTYDFIKSPLLAYLPDEDPLQVGIQKEDRMVDEEYDATIEHVKTALSPYKKQLDSFFSHEYMSSYNLCTLLTDAYPVKAGVTYEDYKESVLAHDEESLKEALLMSLFANEHDQIDMHDPAIIEQAARALKSHETLIESIQGIATEERYRWQLLLILENPKTKVQAYFHLLEQLESIFDYYYDQFKQEIHDVATRLTTLWTQGGAEAFHASTHNVIPLDFLNEEENLFYISFISPYAFAIRQTKIYHHFVWGLRMEKGFKELATLRENQIVKRTQIFKLLGDKTRYEVLRLMAEGITSTKKIAEALDVSSATISYHINAFVTADIVKLTKRKNQKYEINTEILETLFNACLEDFSDKVK